MDTKYLSKIVVNNEQYSIKDAEARQSISDIQSSVTGAMRYIGTSATEIKDEDGASKGPWTISGIEYVASGPTAQQYILRSGDTAIYFDKEYIWNAVAEKWQEFGSTGSLKALAFKNTASGNTTVYGSTPNTNISIADITSSNLITGSIGSASSWSAGTMFAVSVDDSTEIATFTAGTAPSLTITNTTVATGSVDPGGTGSTVVTSVPNSITIAPMSFSASGSVTVS